MTGYKRQPPNHSGYRNIWFITILTWLQGHLILPSKHFSLCVQQTLLPIPKPHLILQHRYLLGGGITKAKWKCPSSNDILHFLYSSGGWGSGFFLLFFFFSPFMFVQIVLFFSKYAPPSSGTQNNLKLNDNAY